MNKKFPPLTYSPQQVIGKAFNLDPAELFAEENRGVIQLGSSILHMQLHLQDEDRILVLMADLGALPARQRNDHYQRMLVANSGWRDLAGGTLCTNDSGDRAHLRLRLDLNTLGGETLAQWTEAFAVAAEDWAKRIAAPDVRNVPNEAPAPTSEFMTRPQDFSGFSPFNRA